MRNLFVRFVIDCGLGIALIQGWWFVCIPLSVCGLWMYPFFVEGVIAGFVYDALYGLIPGMGVRAYGGTIITVGMTLVSGIFKTIVRK